MKSKFNKLLLSTVFAGLSFGCFTPSLAEKLPEGSDDVREEQPAPVKKRNIPRVDEEAPPAPTPQEAAPQESQAEEKVEKLHFENAGAIHLENKQGEGLYFYCSYVGGHRNQVRGAIGDYGPLENVMGRACKACLDPQYTPFNQEPSCSLERCTVRPYRTSEDDRGQITKRFVTDAPEQVLVFDDSVDVSCPKQWKYRVYDDSVVAVGKPVKKGESLQAHIPTVKSSSGRQNDGSFHYESGGSYEYNSNGEMRVRKFSYDSEKGSRSQEIYRPGFPRFYGGSPYYQPGPSPQMNPGQPGSKNKPEVAPAPPKEEKPEKRGSAPKVKPQEERKEGEPKGPNLVPEESDRKPI